MELIVPPGGSPPRHIHDNLDDSFLVLEGEVEAVCGEQTLHARAGSYVVLPAGVAHTFRVLGQTAARLLLVHADDSFLRFIEAVGLPTQDRRVPERGASDLDRGELVRIAAEHDVRIIGASLASSEGVTR